MKRRIMARETAIYVIIAVVVIILFFLLGGRRWMTGHMHGQGINEKSQMEMGSNFE